MIRVVGNKNVALPPETGGLFGLEDRVSVNECVWFLAPGQEGEERLNSTPVLLDNHN